MSPLPSIFTERRLFSSVFAVTRNDDVPGVIGAIGTLLGQNDVNISRLQLGLRQSRGDAALAVINVDSPVSDDVLEKLRQLPHIISVDQVMF